MPLLGKLGLIRPNKLLQNKFRNFIFLEQCDKGNTSTKIKTVTMKNVTNLLQQSAEKYKSMQSKNKFIIPENEILAKLPQKSTKWLRNGRNM